MVTEHSLRLHGSDLKEKVSSLLELNTNILDLGIVRIIFLYQKYLGNYQWKDQCSGKGGGFSRLTHRINYPNKPGHSKKEVFLTTRPNLVCLQVLSNFGGSGGNFGVLWFSLTQTTTFIFANCTGWLSQGKDCSCKWEGSCYESQQAHKAAIYIFHSYPVKPTIVLH